jgi:hypothetical protein
MDLASPRENYDPEKGYEYWTKDGAHEGTYELFAARDFYKRLYWVFENGKGHGQNPFLISHASPILTPLASFWDIVFHGEGLNAKKPYDYTRWFLQKNLISLHWAREPGKEERDYQAASFRMAFPLYQIGVPMMFFEQYFWAKLGGSELCREQLSFTFVHNVLFWPVNSYQDVVTFWNKVEVPYGMGDTVFFPYYSNDIVSSPESVKASYWKKVSKEDYLVAIANWADNSVRASIELPDHLAECSIAEDLLAGTPVSDGRIIDVDIPPHDLKILRFRTQRDEVPQK